DFYEARTDGRVFKGWSDYFVDGWFQTNNAKKYNLNSELMYIKRTLFNSEKYQLSFNQRYRFSKKFSMNYGLTLTPQNNNTGFAARDGSNIIFGKRDIKNVENSMNFKYSFNDKMNLTARLRHYWSKVDYKEFFTLLPDGHLEKNSSFNENVNQNINFFNIDATFTWQFAPGSFINLVWKNAAFDYNQVVNDGYLKNFSNTMKADDNNNISLKIIYFLDYLQLKTHKKKDKKS
ncbi:MAG TPA: DUF5916 domain-containing protein, partial [Chitinophagaceae bacterium]